MSYVKVYMGIDRVQDDGEVISVMGKEAMIPEEGIAAWQKTMEDWFKTWF
jgi:hypothetical protein